MKFNFSAVLVALCSVVICGFAIDAHADILIEPFAGYEFGKIDLGGSSSTITGANYGARLGYQSMGFMIGGEYSLGSLSYKPSGGSNTNVSTTDAGIFVGYNFPVLVRVYATYYLDSTASSSAFSGDLTGTGYRLGIGFTPLPFIVIALEEVNHSYTKEGSSSLSSDDTINATLISLTLPLTF